MATVVRTYADLLAVLRPSPGAGRFIAVDGTRAAGKSTVVKDLARDLPARFISIDDYIVQGLPLGTPYPDLVRLKELMAALDRGKGEGATVLMSLVQLGDGFYPRETVSV